MWLDRSCILHLAVILHFLSAVLMTWVSILSIFAFTHPKSIGIQDTNEDSALVTVGDLSIVPKFSILQASPTVLLCAVWSFTSKGFHAIEKSWFYKQLQFSSWFFDMHMFTLSFRGCQWLHMHENVNHRQLSSCIENHGSVNHVWVLPHTATMVLSRFTEKSLCIQNNFNHLDVSL